MPVPTVMVGYVPVPVLQPHQVAGSYVSKPRFEPALQENGFELVAGWIQLPGSWLTGLLRHIGAVTEGPLEGAEVIFVAERLEERLLEGGTVALADDDVDDAPLDSEVGTPAPEEDADARPEDADKPLVVCGRWQDPARFPRRWDPPVLQSQLRLHCTLPAPFA